MYEGMKLSNSNPRLPSSIRNKNQQLKVESIVCRAKRDKKFKTTF